MTIVADALTLPPPERMYWFAGLKETERIAVTVQVRKEMGTPYGLFADDPVGFTRGVLGEYLWSGEVDLLQSIRDNRRLAIPACHGPGKTHTVARAAVWWIASHEPGSAIVVTTAPTYRQVRNILWPHIRRAHAEHKLPGLCNQVEWQIETDIVGYGFSPARWDDSAAQGVHAEHVLVIIDEAGGILQQLGEALNGILTSEHSRIVAVGNPPIDDQGGWFEQICDHQDQWKTLRIPVWKTPNFTDEKEDVPPHILRRLVTETWVDDVKESYGEDSAYWVARVDARFPKGSSNKVIPAEWITRCMATDQDLYNDEGSSAQWLRTAGAEGARWQRLGVDVASDGGDEMVIAHLDGMRSSIVHVSSAADNSNQVDCAERVLEWIHHAQSIQERTGYTDRKVRVKVDAIGIGRGTADVLEAFGREGRHDAEIVKVNVSEKATEATDFHNRRAEAWWATREVIRNLEVVLAYDDGERTKSQLNGPKWFQDSAGRVQVESKPKMRARGLTSPDRADAVVLSVYEPDPIVSAITSTPADLSGIGRSIPRAPRSRWD